MNKNISTTARGWIGHLRGVTLIAIILSAFLVLGGNAWACPMCTEVAAGQADPAAAEKMQGGFALSLLLLLSTPYLVFGGITFGIVRSVRRKKAAGNPDAA